MFRHDLKVHKQTCGLLISLLSTFNLLYIEENYRIDYMLPVPKRIRCKNSGITRLSKLPEF